MDRIEQLSKLRDQAEDLAQSFDDLLLDGYGDFIRIGFGGTRAIVSAFAVLQMIKQAERKSHALYVALCDLPRAEAQQP